MLFSFGAFPGCFDQLTVDPSLPGALVWMDHIAWCLNLALVFGVLGEVFCN